MAKSRKKSVTLEQLHEALREAAVNFLRRVAESQPGETLYAFLFEISATQFNAHGAVGTEEGLTRYAQKWIDDGKGKEFRNSLKKTKSYFRWGSTEDAWYQQPDEEFNAVNELLNRAEEEELFARYSDGLEKICIAVLRELDAEGRFGVGVEREKVVLGLCYIGGDNSEKEFLGWARQVNSQKVYRRFRKEYLGEA